MATESESPTSPKRAPRPAARAGAPDPARPSTGRIASLLILAGVVILLLWGGLKAWRVYQASQSLLALQSEAEALAAGGVMAMDPDAAEALVLRARQDIVTLHGELRFVRPIAPLLGWVPRVGPTLVASPHLLDMADAGSEAAVWAVRGLKPALGIVQQETFGMAQIGQLLPILSTARPELEAGVAALDRYQAARANLAEAVDEEELPWRVTQLLGLADQWFPIGDSALRLAPALPSLLGQDGPRRYLILAQNEDEMRATGGFITGAGVLTVEDGRIAGLSFSDANQIDNWLQKPYDLPPQPLYELMGLELFLFRDANYWADFPTSAQKAIDLYVYGQDAAPLDGVIAIDQEFLRLLVEALGPVAVPGTGLSIDASNLIDTIRQARDIQEGQVIADWVNDRKAFLGGFAAAILLKLESDFGSIDPVNLARVLSAAAESRHIQIYLRDATAAEALSASGWDGRLPQAPPGDLWMAVDTNVGYNKVNLYIERAFNYEVMLGVAPQARLTIDYRHTGPASDEPCYQGVAEEFMLATDYLTLADQCYWNYLRVHAPAGSRLLDSSRHTVPGETLFSGETWDNTAQVIDDLPWLTTFANFLLTPRGGTASAFFHYELPRESIQTAGGEQVYQLTVFKQPGTRADSLRLSIVLPASASFRQASPTPTTIEGNRLIYELPLDKNIEFTIRYR